MLAKTIQIKRRPLKNLQRLTTFLRSNPAAFPKGWVVNQSDVVGGEHSKQSGLTVTALCPKGKAYTATVSHIIKPASLFVYVTIPQESGKELFVWETTLLLKRSDAMHNVQQSQRAYESLVYQSSVKGIPDEFIRAFWQRTVADRTRAMKACFKPVNVEKKEIEKDPDFFA